MTDSGWQSRTRLLIGDNAAKRLAATHVLVMGMGGVGSFAAEFLVRAGVGRITIVDGDVIEPTNRNRQLPALVTTEGLYKVDVMRERLQQINPDLRIVALREFSTPEKIDRILTSRFDWVVDAIDSLTPKVYLLVTAYKLGMKVVSSMGAGGQVDPTRIRVDDIYKTQKCNLARYVRKRLRKGGVVGGITAVYSLEEVDEESMMFTDGLNYKRSSFGTISYLPAAFAGACASVIVRSVMEVK
ncbi:MAG: tRNA threonylcarbamoyladenosine dehydratase [Ignavibacteria bacterium]|nr:tRNA threonylcarbamoyladenosine dehydratase [Ignavibacteria bacterium]